MFVQNYAFVFWIYFCFLLLYKLIFKYFDLTSGGLITPENLLKRLLKPEIRKNNFVVISYYFLNVYNCLPVLFFFTFKKSFQNSFVLTKTM